MTCQSQHWLLAGTRLEAGGGRERSRMVKGSEAKLVRKRKETLKNFFYFPPPSLPPHRPLCKAFWEKRGAETNILKSLAACWVFEAGIILIFPGDESEA